LEITFAIPRYSPEHKPIEAGFFDESIFIPADRDMWLRLSEKYQVGYINEPLTKYRVSDNTILKSLAQSQKEERVVLKKYFD
jgi:hypothetical protein